MLEEIERTVNVRFNRNRNSICSFKDPRKPLVTIGGDEEGCHDLNDLTLVGAGGKSNRGRLLSLVVMLKHAMRESQNPGYSL